MRSAPSTDQTLSVDHLRKGNWVQESYENWVPESYANLTSAAPPTDPTASSAGVSEPNTQAGQ